MEQKIVPVSSRLSRLLLLRPPLPTLLLTLLHLSNPHSRAKTVILNLLCTSELSGELVKLTGVQAPPLEILIQKVWGEAWTSMSLTSSPDDSDAGQSLRTTM